MNQHFDFPASGDAIEICMDGYRGRRFTVADVEAHKGRTYVRVYDPCPIPDCTEHDDYSTFSVAAVRPFVSG
jgi:hypothetical protein